LWRGVIPNTDERTSDSIGTYVRSSDEVDDFFHAGDRVAPDDVDTANEQARERQRARDHQGFVQNLFHCDHPFCCSFVFMLYCPYITNITHEINFCQYIYVFVCK